MGYELVLFTGQVQEDIPQSEAEMKKAEKKRRKIKSKIAAVRHKTEKKREEIATIAAKIQQMDSELQAANDDVSKAYLEAQEELNRLQKEAQAKEDAKRASEVIIDEEGDDPLADFEAEDEDLGMEKPSKNRAQRRKEEQEKESDKRAKRVKELWRKISMRTHPDRPASTTEKIQIYLKAKLAYENDDLDRLESLWAELSSNGPQLLSQLLEQLDSYEQEYMMTVAMSANLKKSEQYNMMQDWFAGIKGPVLHHFRKVLQARLDQLRNQIDQLKPRHTVNEEQDNDIKISKWR